MITLSGIPYRAESPSLLHMHEPACRAEAQRRLVTLTYDGRSWLIAVHGVYGTREFRTRDEAADLIAQAFTTARENLA